jgi:hypothetical protein
MILHVVGGEGFTPEPARAIEHESFFLSRIFDLDSTPVYGFNESSGTKARVEQMALGKMGFESGSQALSQEFSRLHIGATKDGALFIFELSTESNASTIYALIKYDYSEAIEQTVSDNGSLLRKIVTAFIADKKAIQKAALIRVTNGLADTGLATRDRAKAQPDIGDYFAAFLDAKRELSNEELTERAKGVIRAAITELKDELSIPVTKAYSGALEALRGRPQIDDEALIDAVLSVAGDEPSEEIVNKIRAVTTRKMKSLKLSGVVFKPHKPTLGRPPVHRVRTVEGVTITYPDQLGSNTIKREPTEKGGEVITIRTQKITEEEIVNSVPR